MKSDKTEIVLFEADGKVTGSSASIRQCRVLPLSLKALQAYCENQGHSAVVLEQDRKSLSQLVDEIVSYNPRILAATASTCEFPLTATVMRKIKKKNKDVITVVGGYHVSAYPQSLDPHLCSPDTDPTGIDFLVLGEGELTLAELVNSVKRGNLYSDIKEIKGLAYYEDDKLVTNPPRGLIPDLDNLPRVRWNKEELGRNVFDGLIFRKDPKNKNVVAIISERGCPYACKFCSTQEVYGRTVRTRSIKSLVDEIKDFATKQDVDMIVDYAPTANRDPRRIHQFAQEVRKRGLTKTFGLYHLWRLQTPNGKPMITEELLKDLSDTFTTFKAGIGIEALTENDEEYISKKHSLNNLFSASKAFEKYGAIFRGFFMITPETTKEAINACINSKSLALFDDLRLAYLVPYPGTPFYNQTRNQLITQNWGDFTCQRPVLKSNCLTEEQHEKAQEDIVQGFLLNKYRLERLRKKLHRFPELEPGVRRYHEKMSEHGFDVLNI